MNSLTKIFDFSGVAIRTAGTFEEPLFCLKDICTAIGLKSSGNISAALPSKYKGVVSNDTLGGEQKLVFVTEPGLYKVLIRSRKKAAEKFQEWVCEDVLPSIRKTGSYTSEIQMRELFLRENEACRKNIEMGMRFFSEDDRMVQFFCDYTKNKLLLINEEKEELLSVTEVLMETDNYSASSIKKHCSTLGKRVAAQWRLEFGTEPRVTKKNVNGHRVNVKVYPISYKDTIIHEFNRIIESQG